MPINILNYKYMNSNRFCLSTISIAGTVCPIIILNILNILLQKTRLIFEQTLLKTDPAVKCVGLHVRSKWFFVVRLLPDLVS